MQRRNKPEVLAPAGNLRGLKTAVDYGADAVYCGGKAFGMRSAPKNLSLEDFEEGARYAHERGAACTSPSTCCRATTRWKPCANTSAS